MNRRSTVLAALLAAAVAVPGCGDERFQRTYPTTGRVLVDGNPVEGVAVRFIPKDGGKFRMGETPQGVTGPDGRFTLTTYYQGDGAPAGEYLVSVAEPDQQVENETDDTAPAPGSLRKRKAPPKVPARYLVPQKSGLTATVGPQTNDLPAFELTAKPK